MLTVDDLINIAYIPSEEDISLQLYIDFYEQYLCKKIFIFTLKNGTKVKLFFKDTTEIFHVSGIEHIYEGIPMNGKRFIELVKEGNFDIDQLKIINSNAYKDYIDRICSFACIDTLIKNCEYLWYANGEISGTTIKVKYLLLKGMDGKNLHLGIDTYKKNKPFFAKTLLVTEGNGSNKFINKADERLRVSKIEIHEKNSDELIELIDRETAEQKASELINQKLFEWEKDRLSESLKEFCIHIANELKLVKKFSDILEKDSENLRAADVFLFKNTEISTILQEIGSGEKSETKEWKNLLLEMVKETLCTDSVYSDEFLEEFVVEYYFYDLVDYLHTHKGKFIKLVAIPEIKEMLDFEKQNIRDEIDKYDKYWSGKIVGEQIREKQKKYIKGPMEDAVKNILEDKKQTYIKILLKNMPVNDKEKLIDQFVELIYSRLLETHKDKIR